MSENYISQYTGKEIEERLNSHYTETILFEVDVDNTNFGTITLSDSLSNYDYIDIYAATDDLHCLYQRVYKPNGKFVTLNVNLISTYCFNKTKVYKLEGNKMETNVFQNKIQAGVSFYNTAKQEHIITLGEEYIGVYLVIGYKKPTL